MTFSPCSHSQNSEEQSSQFQSLEQVKRRPAHLMALLQHVALQFEPGPLVRVQLRRQGRGESGTDWAFSELDQC
jgi:hypothetical protein